jgi:hypothetical protein
MEIVQCGPGGILNVKWLRTRAVMRVASAFVLRMGIGGYGACYREGDF